MGEGDVAMAKKPPWEDLEEELRELRSNVAPWAAMEVISSFSRKVH